MVLVLLVLELPNVPHVHVVVAPPGGDDEHPVGVVLEEGVGLADDENLGDSPPGAVEHVDLPAVPPPAHLEEYDEDGVTYVINDIFLKRWIQAYQ